MKYDKESLKKLSWDELLDLSCKISNRIRLVAILNICLCIVYFFLEGWMKTCCVTVTTIITVLLIIQTVMNRRVEKIMEDTPL